MPWRLPTKEELRRNAEGARRRTEEHVAKMKKIRAEIKRITIPTAKVVEMIKFAIMMEKQHRISEWFADEH